MSRHAIDYPPEVLSALQQDAGEFEDEARRLLALKLYETGKLSSGLAARLAGMSRTAFLFFLGQHGLSAFGETPEELSQDLADARRARRRQ
jgi:predicted HTH domain antitoxin